MISSLVILPQAAADADHEPHHLSRARRGRPCFASTTGNDRAYHGTHGQPGTFRGSIPSHVAVDTEMEGRERHRLSLVIPSADQSGSSHADDAAAPSPPPRPDSTSSATSTPVAMIKRHAHLHLHHHHHNHNHNYNQRDRHGAKEKGSGSGGASSKAGPETRVASKALSAKTRQSSSDAGRDDSRQGQACPQGLADRDAEVGASSRGARLWIENAQQTDGQREAGLSKLREQRKLQDETISTTLTRLDLSSTAAIRKLDDTYYTILESLSKLQATLSSIQQISSATTQLSRHFDDEARDVERHVTAQVAAFGAFGEQRKKIDGLGRRVKHGRDRVGELSGRLDRVREMVTVWERREVQWRDGIQRRLRLLWLLLSLSVVVFAVFYTRQHLSRSSSEVDGVGPAHARTAFVTTGDTTIDDSFDVSIHTNDTEAAQLYDHHYHGQPHHHRDAPTRHTRDDGVGEHQHESGEEHRERKENEDMDLWRDEGEKYAAKEGRREQLFERVRGRLDELI